MRESVLGPKRLELYHSYTDYSSGLLATFVLNLGDMLHVERNLDPHHKISIPSYSSRYHWDKRHYRSSIEPPGHQFTITTEKDVHIFSTRSGDESSFWVGKLNELLHGPPEQGVECKSYRHETLLNSMLFGRHGCGIYVPSYQPSPIICLLLVLSIGICDLLFNFLCYLLYGLFW